MNRRLAQGFRGDEPTEAASDVVAVVAIGANLGHRHETIAEALKDLARLPLTTNVLAAEPIETVAVTPSGPDPDAPAYLNTVALLTTRLAPSMLLTYLQAIEARHGRERTVRWGDRTLDLDLIAHGDVRTRSSRLTLPHPRAAEREFVLEPWSRIDPDAVLPGHGPVSDLLAHLREVRS